MTADTLAALVAVIAREPQRTTRVLSDAEIAHEDRLEAIAEERAWDRTHRRLSRGEEQDRQNAAEAWLDRIGGSA